MGWGVRALLSGVIGVGAFRFAAASPVQQRLRRLSIVLGVTAVLSSLAVGVGAYQGSRRALSSHLTRSAASLGQSVRHHAELLYERGEDPMEALSEAWRASAGQEQGLYLCFVAPDGTLSLHTRRADRIGANVGATRINDEGREKRVLDLVASGRSWAGENVNFGGVPQVVAYEYSSALGGLVTVHVPKATIDGQAWGATLPWLLGLGLIAVVLLPAALLSMHATYRRAQAAYQAAREEQEALEHRLHQTQRLEAIGGFANGIAHDFNNLLTVVLGNCNGLRERLSEHEDIEAFEQIEQASHRATRLIQELLAFARKQPGEREVVDPGAVIANVRAVLLRLMDEDVGFLVDVEEGLGRIEIATGQLEQIITNLVVNARDAVSPGGQLGIRARNVQHWVLEGEPEKSAGPAVMIEVWDDGCGMSRETIDRAFEPFFSTKAKDRGTGLGLSTVHGLVQQSSGEVAIESQPGQGTRVRVYFPRVVKPLVAESSAREVVVDVGRRRILLVEDEAAVRSVLVRMLGKRYEVTAVSNAAEALARFDDRSHGPYDLLVSDVVMPGMGGPALARELRGRCPALRVLLVSGYSPEPANDEDDGDAFEVLRKPFTAKALLNTIARVLA